MALQARSGAIRPPRPEKGASPACSADRNDSGLLIEAIAERSALLIAGLGGDAASNIEAAIHNVIARRGASSRRAVGIRSVGKTEGRQGFPKFPLTAGTGRQIIFSLPHGEAVPMRPMPFGHRGMPSASARMCRSSSACHCMSSGVSSEGLLRVIWSISAKRGTILPGATRPSLCRDVWESFETSKHQVVPPAGRLSKVSRSDSGIPPSWRASEEPRSGVRFSTMRRQ